MQLRALASIPAGDLVLMERPFVSVPQGIFAHGTHAWELTAAVLASPAHLQQLFAAQLKMTEFLRYPGDLPTERALSSQYKLERAGVRKIFFIVSTNNISYFDAASGVAGWGLYEMLSRANHSCEPNTRLVPGDHEHKEAGLVATRDIEPGEPVTWNYSGSEPFLAADWETRNHGLVNYMRFVCQCPRCIVEAPAQLRNPAEQLRYFDGLIRAEAVEAATSMPELTAKPRAVRKTSS